MDDRTTIVPDLPAKPNRKRRGGVMRKVPNKTAAELGISQAHFDLLLEAGDMPGETPGSVYFLGMNDMVKIGYSAGLRWRLFALSASVPYSTWLILAIAGSFATENCLHQKFDDIRRNGEWFERTPKLREYIDSLRAPA